MQFVDTEFPPTKDVPMPQVAKSVIAGGILCFYSTPSALPFREYSAPTILKCANSSAYLRPWHMPWEPQMGCKGLVEPES